MIRTTAFALAALALAASAPATPAKAGSYSNGYDSGYSSSDDYDYHPRRYHRTRQCHWEKQRIIVSYRYDGSPRYGWQRVKICH